MNDLTVLQERVFPILASATARVKKSPATDDTITAVPRLQERCYQIMGIARTAYRCRLRPQERVNLHLLRDKLAREMQPHGGHAHEQASANADEKSALIAAQS